MKKILSSLILLSFFACSSFGTEFQVSSQRDSQIDSVIISNGFNDIKLYNLSNDKKYQSFLDFTKKNDTLIGDGVYNIEVYQRNRPDRILNFGYYSNGIPSSGFKVVIQMDTILIDEVWD